MTDNVAYIADSSMDVEKIPANDAAPTLLDALDPDLTARLSSRRDLFVKASATLGVLATAPMLLASVSSEALGLGLGPLLPRQIVDVLNFALTLEYLENEFYSIALNTSGLIPDRYRTVFAQIGKHEAQHVLALNVVLGIAAARKPQFDFTAGGRYPGVFSNFGTFSTLSQTFEDLGVKAYKGQAPNLMSNSLILTTALRIHSVEARHAAEVRRVRNVRPWDGAFDSALSKDQVLAMAAPFIVG